MRNVRACAACLATDVRMHSLASGGLLQAYRLLSGRQSGDVIPWLLCWQCAAIVEKFIRFRHKCDRAYRLLQSLCSGTREVNEDHLKMIDRKEHRINSSYGYSKISIIDSYHVTIDGVLDADNEFTENCEDVLIKFEKVELDGVDVTKTEAQKELNDDDIKMEIDYDAGVLHAHSNHSECNFSFPIDDSGWNRNTSNYEFEEDLPISMLKKRRKHVSGKRESPKAKSDCRQKRTKDVSACKLSTNGFKATEIVLTPEEAKAIYAERKLSKKFKRARLKCSYCFHVFTKENVYKRHSKKHDPKLGEYECDICKMRFNGRDDVRKHISIQHTKKYICNICSKVSYTREIAKHHYRAHARGAVLREKKKKPLKVKNTKAMDFDTTQVTLSQEQMMEVVRERQNAEGYSSARFKCSLCFKTFNEQKPFNNHMLQHDPVSGPLECDICKVRVRTRRKLYKHISCNHMTRYSCDVCPHVCYNRATALKHFSWHKGVVYTCHICGATTLKMSTHLSHLRIKHPSQHICGDCGESFVSQRGLYHHSKKMHSIKPSAVATSVEAGPYCADCDVQFSSTQAWTRHILLSPKHEDEKQVLNGCRECGETFASPDELKRHHKTQHKRNQRCEYNLDKNFPTKCEQCEELMPSAGKYWQHFRQQHPGKQFPLTRSSFICEYCGKWFKHKSTLDIHTQSHQEVDKRVYQCAKCPKRFVKVSSLAAHARCHGGGGGGAQFVCDVCSRQFMYKHSLTNHFRTHKIEKPHTCDWCGKTFAYDCNLKRHTLAVHCDELTQSGSTSHKDLT